MTEGHTSRAAWRSRLARPFRKRWKPLPDDAPEPDIRGPVRYLWWLVRRQPGRVARGALWGSLWMVALMLPPYVIARGVDEGLQAGEYRALAWWSAALLAIGMLNAALSILRHRTMTFVRMYGSFHTIEVLTRHTVRLGSAFARRSSTGDLVTVTGADVTRLSQSLTLTGPGVGAVVAYGAVTVVLLSISVPLAVVVLLGVPLLALCLGPLLNRLQAAESQYRVQQGALTERAVDIVAGLRVMSGIGGRGLFTERYRQESQRLRQEGYRVGAATSWVAALTVGLPSLFLAAVTWLAARMVASGELTVGELVAVYGYVAVLIVPVFFVIESLDQLVRALVSARRVIRILRVEPEPETVPADTGAGTASKKAAWPTGYGPSCELRDPDSGLVVPRGALLGLVPRRPRDGVAAVDRLGRYGDTRATLGDVPLAALPLADIRAHILVAPNEAYLFAGSLRQTVSPGPELAADAAIHAAVRVAAAEDVVAALPGGLDAPIAPQARNLSGGQRQRLRLARAVLAEPEVLLLVEPTSAVDAHTEALVASRLRAAREGRTTVVVTTSPLLLDQADQVVFLDDTGQLAASGTHSDLLAVHEEYRQLVFRGAEPDLSHAGDGSLEECP